MTFEKGTQVFIIENSRSVREATVAGRSGDFYTIQFGNKGAIQLRGSRLYATKEEAEAILPKRQVTEKKKRYHSPYDYWH